MISTRTKISSGRYFFTRICFTTPAMVLRSRVNLMCGYFYGILVDGNITHRKQHPHAFAALQELIRRCQPSFSKVSQIDLYSPMYAYPIDPGCIVARQQTHHEPWKEFDTKSHTLSCDLPYDDRVFRFATSKSDMHRLSRVELSFRIFTEFAQMWIERTENSSLPTVFIVARILILLVEIDTVGIELFKEGSTPDAIPIRDHIRYRYFARPWKKTKSRASYFARRSEAAQPRTSLFDSRLSVLQSRDHPFIPSPLSFVSTTILDACSRRGSMVGGERLWMTQVMGNVGQQVMLPHPRWTSLQWGFIYETRCRPAKDISTDVQMGSRCAINVPIMNDLVRMLFQDARSQWDFDSISCHEEMIISHG